MSVSKMIIYSVGNYQMYLFQVTM